MKWWLGRRKVVIGVDGAIGKYVLTAVNRRMVIVMFRKWWLGSGWEEVRESQE